MLAFGLGTFAQIKIQILDDTQRPLVQAHVTYRLLVENAVKETVLSDEQGALIIPVQKLPSNPLLELRISYIGFVDIVDTVSANSANLDYTMSPEAQVLNQFVVTAQYSPNSPDKAVHKVRIIDQKKMERMAAVNLEDVLTNEVNIRISQDGIFGSGLSMQGLSGENVKIMIDGVPIIGRQDGSLDLNQINLNDIERIEIIEGPLSVNYGTSALAGTINLITKKESSEKTNVSATSYYETIGTYNFTGQFAKQIGKARVSLNGGRNFFDGWSPGDPMDPNSDDFIADSTRVDNWNPREQYFLRAAANYRFKKVLGGYRYEYFDEIIKNRGMPGNEVSAFDDTYKTLRTDHNVFLNGEVAEGKNLEFVAAYNRYTRQKNTYIVDLTTLDARLSGTDGSQDTSSFDLWMSRASMAFNKDSSWIHWQVGYDVSYETGTGRRIENTEQAMGNYALFTTAEVSPFSALTIRPGLRYAYNTVFDSPLTPSLNVRYNLNKWILRGSYARGFRAPSLKELHFYFVDINHNIVGNQDLKAEYSHNFSASVKRQQIIKQRILQFELGGFYNDVQNLIDLVFIDVEAQSLTYNNIGRSRTQGVNGSISMMFEHLKANLGASYIGLNNSIANAEGSKTFYYYPEATGNLTYDWKKTGVSASLFYKYQGRLPRTTTNDNGELVQEYVDDYHTLDANLARSFIDRMFTLTVGAKNILDVQNVGFNGAGGGGAHSGGGSSVLVSTGRLYFLKLDFRWSR
tara:strand:- start:9613 stop:11844 length:2232 start_codon:yes stop_codon:yes gene_type:complete